MDKTGLEFGFAWLFAIIVGAAILFMAIYAVTQLIDSGEKETTSKVAVEFANVLDPLQSVVSESKGGYVDLFVEARIFNSCNLEGNFGNSVVSFSEKISFGGGWTKRGLEKRTNNAYLFSENQMQGERVEFLTFPFNMPYKAGDILIAYTDNYCIVNAPSGVKNELKFLTGDGDKVIFVQNTGECNRETKSVCFSGSCDVKVQCSNSLCNSGYVDKEGKRLYFSDKLIYAAIFSSAENYECNVHRLVKRLGIVSDIYSKKSAFTSNRGCVNVNIRPAILSLKESTNSYEELSDLIIIESLAKEIDDKNEVLECQLY